MAALKVVHPPKNPGHEILLKSYPACASSSLGSSGRILGASPWVTSWACPVCAEDMGNFPFGFRTAKAQQNRNNTMAAAAAAASRQLRALTARPCVELPHPSLSSNLRYAAKCSAFASSMAAASLILCRSMDRLHTVKKCPPLLHVASSRFSSFSHPHAHKRSGVSYQSAICVSDTNCQRC